MREHRFHPNSSQFYGLSSALGIKAGHTGQAMVPHPKTISLAPTILLISATDTIVAALGANQVVNAVSILTVDETPMSPILTKRG